MDTVPRDTSADTFSEDLDAAVGSAVGMLRQGWVVLRDCVLLEDDPRLLPARLGYALLHPNVGVALLDVAPDRTPDAVARLRRRLDKAKFSKSFPGYLPVVYRSLPTGDLHRLGDVFDEAFGGEGAINLSGGHAWMDSVRRALTPEAAASDRGTADDERHGTWRQSASPSPFLSARRGSGTGPRAGAWSWALVLLAFGGGAAVMYHLDGRGGLLLADVGHRATGPGKEAATPTVIAPDADGIAGAPEGYAAPPLSPTASVMANSALPANASVPVPDPEPRAARPTSDTAVASLMDRPAPVPAPGSAATVEPVTPATQPEAPDVGRIGEHPGIHRLRQDPPAPSSDAPGRFGVEATPALAAADQLSAEITTLERRLEALQGGLAESGSAADEARFGGVSAPVGTLPDRSTHAPPAAAVHDNNRALGSIPAEPAEPAPSAPVAAEAVASTSEPPPAPTTAQLRADAMDTPPSVEAKRFNAVPEPAPAPENRWADAEATTRPDAKESADTATPANEGTPSVMSKPGTGGSAEATMRAVPPAAPQAGPVGTPSSSPPTTVAAPYPPLAEAAGRPGAAPVPTTRGGQARDNGPVGRDTTPVPAAAPVSSALATAYIARGDALVERRDISAARLFYERVATGNAKAAAALAKTYDPQFLAEAGLRGTFADTSLAVAWYRKAASLGDSGALARAESLDITSRSAQERP